MLGGRAAELGARLLSVSVLARILGPDEFGIVTPVVAIAVIGKVLAEVGMSQALVQARSISADSCRFAMLVSAVSGVSVAIVFVLLTPMWRMLCGHSGMDVQNLYVCIFASILVSSLASVPTGMLTRHLAYRTLAAISFGAFAASSFGVALPLALAGWSFWALAFAYLANDLICAILLYAAYVSLDQVEHRGGGGVTGWSLIRASFGFLLSRMGNQLTGTLDRLLVSNLAGQAAVGIYGRAQTLAQLPITVFMQGVQRVAFGHASRHQDNIPLLRERFLLAVSVAFLVSSVCSYVLYVSSDAIVAVLFGALWVSLVPIIAILAWVLIPKALSKTADVFVHACGMAYRRSMVQWSHAAMLMILIPVGWFVGELPGIVVAVLVASALTAVMMVRLALATLDIRVGDFLSALAGPVRLVTVSLASAHFVHLLAVSSGAPSRLSLFATTLVVVAGSIALAACWPTVFLNAQLAETRRAVLARICS